jgi:hypothetical protein
MPAIGIGVGMGFKSGFDFSSYWKSRTDFWFKEGTRSGLTLPNGVNPGTDDASILLPMVDASATGASNSLKLDTGVVPAANTVFVLKGRSTVTTNHNIGLEDDANTTYFILGINTSKWRCVWGNKSKSSVADADTDFHVFIMYDAKLWVRPIATELTDASVLNVINTIAPDIDGTTASPAWTGTALKLWLGSMNYTSHFPGSFAHSNCNIGTITAGVITWQKKFITNNIKYAYDIISDSGSAAWVNNAGTTPTAPVKLYSQYGDDYCLNNGHTLLRKNAGELYSSVPYLTSGAANHTVANLTGYETVGDFAGDSGNVNYTDCLIQHSLAFFDRSNATIWSALARAATTYYDSTSATTKKRFHVSEHNQNKLAVWLNAGYEGRLFVKTDSNSMDYYTWTRVLEIINTTANQENSAYDKALRYSGDYNLWNYPIWNKSTFAVTDIQKSLNNTPIASGQTDNIETFGNMGVAATFKWSSAVELPNGKIMGVPFSQTDAVILNTADDSVVYVPTTASNYKWGGGILAPNNGCVYMIPSQRLFIGKIDPSINLFNELANAITDSGTINYFGGVLSQNGMIYCVPYSSNLILKIDPITDTWSEFDCQKTINSKWAKGILAPNGFIYMIPHSETAVLKLNPSDDSISFFGNIAGTYKWASACITPSGIIYAMPYSDTRILKIDTNTDTISFIATASTLNNESYGSTILAPNGMIYGIPFYETEFIKLNPLNDSVSYFGDMTTEVPGFTYGAVLARNGKIYAFPYLTGTKALKLLTSYTVDKNITLSRVINKMQ